MNAAITLGKDTELVEKLDKDLVGNLKWLAEQLEKLGDLRNEKITAPIAMRHAISMDALLIEEMLAKSKILIKKKDGKTSEIRIDRNSLIEFKGGFTDYSTNKPEHELIPVEFSHEILSNVKWVAVKLEEIGGLSKNSITLPITLRHAIAMDALLLDEMEQGSRILIQKKNGVKTEIRVDRQAVLSFKEMFGNS